LRGASSFQSSASPLELAIDALPAARLESWSDDIIIVAASDDATLRPTPFGAHYQSIAAAAAAGSSSAATARLPTVRPSWGCALRVPAR
jgi:hypothetical protein